MNPIDFVCGMLLGWTHVSVGQPLDIIKVRIQTAKTQIKIVDIIKDIYKNYGLRGFYRGSSTLFIGYSGTVATQFLMYQWAKRHLYQWWGKRSGPYDPDKINIWEAGLSGSFAGLFLACIYCPIEYAKIQRQTSAKIHESAVRLLLREIYTKGIRHVYKGFLVTTLRDMTGCFVYFSTYEGLVRTWTANKREEADGLVYMGAGAAAGMSFLLTSYPLDTIKSNLQAGLTWKESLANSMQMSKLAGYKVAFLWAILINSCGFWVYEHAQLYLNSVKNKWVPQ